MYKDRTIISLLSNAIGYVTLQDAFVCIVLFLSIVILFVHGPKKFRGIEHNTCKHSELLLHEIERDFKQTFPFQVCNHSRIGRAVVLLLFAFGWPASDQVIVEVPVHQNRLTRMLASACWGTSMPCLRACGDAPLPTH